MPNILFNVSQAKQRLRHIT